MEKSTSCLAQSTLKKDDFFKVNNLCIPINEMIVREKEMKTK